MTMTKEMMTMKHVCRKDGRAVGPLDGPAWLAPGEIVKIADEENWGRVVIRWQCCDSYDVRVSAFGEQEAGDLTVRPATAFENAWDAYPANMPPRGYPVPKHVRRAVRVGGLPK
jgi:hypothetical protein